MKAPCGVEGQGVRRDDSTDHNDHINGASINQANETSQRAQRVAHLELTPILSATTVARGRARSLAQHARRPTRGEVVG